MKQFWKRAAVAIVSLALLAGMPPAAGAASDEVEAALASMTLREKVGQLFAVRPEALDFEQRSGGMKLTCSMREHLRSYPVGGIVLFATNISSQSQMTALIRDFQRSAGNSLLVAVDEEGGPVARLANSSAFDLPKFPSASAIGTTGDPEQARTMGRTIGGYLKHYGFNLDLAPVADVNSNPLNPVIGRRAFSSDPDVTAGMVRAAVQGFHEAGMLCTLKHFPGHGDTLEDSHAGTATSTKTWEEMKAVELLPFEEVDYWEELTHIIDWTETNVTSTIYLCWAAQAGLYYHYGLQKKLLDHKMFGLFRHRVLNRKIPLVRGFDDEFYAPHSRHTDVPIEEIRKVKELTILAESDEAGLFLAMADNGRKIFVMGHPEYDRVTLDGEYKRDLGKGLPIDLPENYYPDDNPDNKPLLMWRSHANNLYTNWLNYYVYQVTPYDLDGTPDFSRK